MADRITDYAVNSARWLSLEDFEGEVWKDSRFENYSVSNLGRIKRQEHCTIAERNGRSYTMLFKEKLIRQIHNKGYLMFSFIEDGRKTYIGVHRIVAEAFISNTNSLPLVNHKAENKSNNNSCNLEWCSEKYNSNYGNANIKRSFAISCKRMPICKEIKQYYCNGMLTHTYRGGNEITNAGFCYSCVCKCCKHRIVSYKGYNQAAMCQHIFPRVTFCSAKRYLLSGERSPFAR